MNLPSLHCYARHRRCTAVVLVLLLLAMQSTLTFLVTPSVDTDHQTGQVTITLCTLQGLQEIVIDLGGTDASDEPPHCPALDLHKLIATGIVDFHLASVIVPAPRALTLIPRSRPDYRTENYPAFSGRAPPLV